MYIGYRIYEKKMFDIGSSWKKDEKSLWHDIRLFPIASSGVVSNLPETISRLLHWWIQMLSRSKAYFHCKKWTLQSASTGLEECYLVIHQPPLIQTVSINNSSTVASESLSCSFSMTPVKGPLSYCHRKLANHGYHQILGMILRRTRSDITRSNSGNPQIVDKHQMWFEQITRKNNCMQKKTPISRIETLKQIETDWKFSWVRLHVFLINHRSIPVLLLDHLQLFLETWVCQWSKVFPEAECIIY